MSIPRKKQSKQKTRNKVNSMSRPINPISENDLFKKLQKKKIAEL